MTSFEFVQYAMQASDTLYDIFNLDENCHYKPRELGRIIPIYKQLKLTRPWGISYINAFIHPNDKDAEFVEDLKYEHTEF